MRAVVAALLISLLPCASGARTADQQCLALNIYHEAQGTDAREMKAIANVTINRVKSSKFPDSICSVVYQRGQFSWTRDGESDRPTNSKEFTKADQIASRMIINQNDITSGALYFYNWKQVRPKWSYRMKETLRTEYHSFRKEIRET